MGKITRALNFLTILSVSWLSSLASAAGAVADKNFPLPLGSYGDEGLDLMAKLAHRVSEDPFNIVALVIFLLAICHTFAAGKIMHLSNEIQHRYEEKKKQEGREGEGDVSFVGQLLHFLGEVEAIFGIWVLVLMGAIAGFKGWDTVVYYVNHKVVYIEPMFVVVIMTISATRPILNFSEHIMRNIAKLGKESVAAWWLTILTVAPVLGSFITEPAAMTIAALLLAKQFYRLKPNPKFMYATLGLLFVNISVGGTLTNFAAPPVLMVAAPWDWSTGFMLANFGWKAVVGIVLANVVYFVAFKKDFKALQDYKVTHGRADNEVTGTEQSLDVPFWVTLVHMVFLLWTVLNAHYPALFIGGFLFFLGFKEMTPQYQDRLELKTAILVGFFLAGLVNHGGVQGWWIAPVLGCSRRGAARL